MSIEIKPRLLEGQICFPLMRQAYIEGSKGADEPYIIAVHHSRIVEFLDKYIEPYGLQETAKHYKITLEEYKKEVIQGNLPLKFLGASFVVHHNEEYINEIRFHSLARERELVILNILE